MSVIRLDYSKMLMSNTIYQNEEIVHKILMKAMGYRERTQTNLLYRNDQNKMCVYSDTPLRQDVLMQNGYIVQNVDKIGELYQQIAVGDVVKLYFRTSPSKKMQRMDKKNSARIALRKKCDRIAWVERKLSNSGMSVVYACRENPLILENGEKHLSFEHSSKQKNRGAHKLVVYDYVATVKIENKDLFLETIKCGIGPYKSYGCGLILVGAV